MKKRNLAIIIFLASAGVGFWVYRPVGHGGVGKHTQAIKYYCPMHPSYTSDKPGDCPICNMKLVPMEEEAGGGPLQGIKGRSVCVLHNCHMTNCPMEVPGREGGPVTCPVCGTHVFQSDGTLRKVLYWRDPMKPKVTSPGPKKDEMGMDFIPVYAEQSGMDDMAKEQVPITLSQERRQMIGLKTEFVARRPLRALVRASGRAAYDPDLYNAISEYREAVKARDKVKESPWPDVVAQSGSLVRASDLRLRQMGLSVSQINEIAASSAPPVNLLIGEAGGTVWVYVQIYEYEIGLVKPGANVKLTSPAYPGRSFQGVIKAIDPILSAETRSLKARIEVPNPEGLIKLEMYMDAAIEVNFGRQLALPEGALMDTGRRKLAFVDLGEGRLEPREVRVGREADGYYELLDGVDEGERVVTSANFLIDSESRLKASMARSKSRGATEPLDAPSGHKH